MLPVEILGFMLFFLAATVDGQGIRFVDDDDDYRPRNSRRQTPGPLRSCDANSYCVPIQRCSYFSNRRDWRTAGDTCEYGRGEYRRVCCPRRSSRRRTNSRPRSTPMRPSDSRPTPVRPFPRTAAPPTISNSIIPDGCGQSRPSMRAFIMGGENATEGAWPWMVAIRRRRSTGSYIPWCTGFLIDSRHALTAAHCFDGERAPESYTARIGRVDQNQGEEYRVIRIAIPDGYVGGMFYDDIAVMTLDREVTSPDFSPVCLPDEIVSSRDMTNRGTTAAGWGADRPGGDLKVYLKQLSGITVTSNQRCNRIFRQTLGNMFQRQFPNGINSGFICAGYDEEGQDTCGGDSGGPLMHRERNRWFAIGIVSFGYSCGRPGIPGGYTKVSNYLSWISENTRD